VAVADATPAGTMAAMAARAAKVFWLRLPNGRPRLRNTGGVAARLLVFFQLPFGRRVFVSLGHPHLWR
jgi:hypothetical protein